MSSARKLKLMECSECLALLTAYPVTLVEQIRGNTCEPAIVRYCREMGQALKRLQDDDEIPVQTTSLHAGKASSTQDSSLTGEKRFPKVEYFFEVFSLQLQLEYSRRSMKPKAPSMATQHVIFHLRNHFENLVDNGNLDDRRMPIVRQSSASKTSYGSMC